MHAHETMTGRLFRILLATLALFALEAAAAFYTRSLALLADSAHMLADVVALGLAWGARRIAARPANTRHTFGYARFELLSAALNAALLLTLSLAVAVTALRHLAEPPVRHPQTMLVVAALGLAVNVGAFLALRRDAERDLNIRAALAEVTADGLGSLMVLVSAVVIARSGWVRIDALASLAIALLMLPRALSLGREAVHLLADGVPRQIDLARVETRLASIDGITGVHDVHVWSLGASRVAVSAHLAIAATANATEVLRRASALSRDVLAIDHDTFQIERAGDPCAGAGCCAAASNRPEDGVTHQR